MRPPTFAALTTVVVMSTNCCWAGDPLGTTKTPPIIPTAMVDRPCTPQAPAAPAAPAQPQAVPPQAGQQPQTNAFNNDAFAQGPPAGTETSGGFNPQMMGDFAAYPSVSTITVRALLSNTSLGLPYDIPNFATVTEQVRALVADVSRGAFKIAEDESPQPQDRVYVDFRYFRVPVQVLGASTAITPLPGSFGVPTSVPNLTNTTLSSMDVYRETIGVEKTFLNGNASLGLRVPIFQSSQSFTSTPNSANIAATFAPGTTESILGTDSPIGDGALGDISVILKYAFVNTCDRVLSGGVVVTTPTGPLVHTVGGDLQSVLVQPYVGYYCSRGGLYLHGFTSFVASTDQRDVDILFNDVGVGYWIFQNRSDCVLSGVAPTVEVHVNTPFNHRGTDSDTISAFDLIDVTGGVNFQLGKRSLFTVGAVTPVTGPHCFDFEAIAQLNVRF